jgi:hypothetical protein
VRVWRRRRVGFNLGDGYVVQAQLVFIPMLLISSIRPWSRRSSRSWTSRPVSS